VFIVNISHANISFNHSEDQQLCKCTSEGQ